MRPMGSVMSELSNKDPSAMQEAMEIEQFLRATKEDDEVAIRNTHGGVLMFHITKVTGKKPSSGRLYTDKTGLYAGPGWFMRSGKNCRHPTGQTNLVIPTPEVLQFIEEHPQGHSLYWST